jgi:hypothetical protein
MGGTFGARHRDIKCHKMVLLEKTEKIKQLGDLELEGKTMFKSYSKLIIEE